MSAQPMAAIDRERLRSLVEREQARFDEMHPRSHELHERAQRHLLGGVPMPWMTLWPGGYPVVLAGAEDARVTDVDGHEYVDFCLGDTGAMAGHAPPATVAAIEAQARRGITAMLPTEDAAWVGAELARRFGLDYWSFALSATDANRFALRVARFVTNRPKVLVFNGCYHGTVDETLATLDERGVLTPRHGSNGRPVDPALTTTVVEFNDSAALERALAPGDVAAVLAEPALTNVGIVPPAPEFHGALREITRRAGTLLIIDETHTISSGPGGYTAAYGLEPDLLTVGKALAGGVPVGMYGMTAEVAARLAARGDADLGRTEGVGGTLAGNALSLAALRATLEHVLTDAAFARMIDLAGAYARGVDEVIRARRLPWVIVQLGARAEYRFCPALPRDGGSSARAGDPLLDEYLHLYLLNRDVLITPFHNMALMCPATTATDVERLTAAFTAAVDELLAAA
jgi:glutamate-1-semialdehyde 2,1-aminomutase